MVSLLAFAASAREGSVNRKLVTYAAGRAEAQDANVTLVDYCTLDMPAYNDHLFEHNGLPEAAQRLADQIMAHDGLMIALPEYNWSYPGSAKNIIDWISRLRPVPLAGKSALLLSASPSLQGGIKGLLHFRVPLEALGTYVYPSMITVSDAFQQFDEDGTIHHPVVSRDVTRTVERFVQYTHKLTA